MERLASEYIREIDNLGGMLRAIEKGYPQQEIEHAAYEYQRSVESGAQTVVGVNRFTVGEPASVPLLRIDPQLEGQQIQRLSDVRARRDAGAVEDALNGIEKAAGSDENLMPRIIQAVEAYATLGEVSDRLRRVFGEYAGVNYE
jgi:methylmalonyl-CoA mutase N-terminal domain/subunit